MNFFEHQDRARSNSRRMVFLFIIAVVLIVLAVNLAVGMLFFSFFEFGAHEMQHMKLNASMKAHGIVSLITLLVIGGASWYRMSKLRSGGDMVAVGMGGTWVDPDSTDPALRRLCNVVEEMSVASGLPTPHIYVLEAEKGINAFAAGYTPEDAAVAVSRGALDQLNRDELQGVIAHEFTHILNGDMRMNIRMMGILYGILAISVIGRGLLHSGGRRKSFISNRKQGGGGPILGLGLMLVGYIGVFFGRLIKASVSRQREYLADACAVQFTRNPDGIGGALKKIAGYSSGSQLKAADREEVSHMLFATGQSFWFSMLATHPPIEERIKAIDPRFRPEDLERRASADTAKNQRSGIHGAFASSSDPWAFLTGKNENVAASAFSAAVTQDVETPDPEHLDHAVQVVSAIPDALLDAARSRSEVLALFPALFLAREKDMRALQMGKVEEMLNLKFAEKVELLTKEAEKMHPLLTLPLTDLAFSALRQLDAPYGKRLVALLEAMVAMDGKVTVFEYCLVRLLKRRLAEAQTPNRKPEGARCRGAQCREALVNIFSVLAWQGHESETLARRAFLAGISRMLPMDVPLYEVPVNWERNLDMALEVLDGLDFVTKGELVQALLVTASHDGRLSLEEAELLRMICACLHIPVPPVLPELVA
ncbi:M48 family metallopeptidase [Desulfobotulus mexicanus]|uniref:M48 family metallopeptidase n=1 Tax=Desulfobotulus mexicanus TaxID=2586642 RepID=A0A5S5MDM2_9BACT|nr:M48 family metallopeptidase [Desulfobotulus mexicanus]TYT73813.1 M48 family metallopeptidase [Desulfobotulus mexicanus]